MNLFLNMTTQKKRAISTFDNLYEFFQRKRKNSFGYKQDILKFKILT